MEKTTSSQAIRSFLKKGGNPFSSEETLIKTLEKEIQKISHKSLKDAARLSREYFLKAGRYSDRVKISATKMYAMTSHRSGMYVDALMAYGVLRRLFYGKPDSLARVDRALVDVHMYLGKYPQAAKHAEKALMEFKKQGLWPDYYMTLVNFANLRHRQDKHREAEKLYFEAAEYFQKSGDNLSTARCNYNRANTLVQLFEFEKAEAAYRAAEKVYEESGHGLDANDARYGLAWLKMLQGKFHVALLELEKCENAYKGGGDKRGEGLCQLDRAEVFIGLGLYIDAYQAALNSRLKFKKLGMPYETAKAALFAAQAASSLNNPTMAWKLVGEARQVFFKEKNEGFQGVCWLLIAELSNSPKGQNEAALKNARIYFENSQLPLWEAICDLRAAQNPRMVGEALKRLAKNPAARNAPHLAAFKSLVQGDEYYRKGHNNKALTHWRKAADILDKLRAEIPPFELRTSFARREKSPHVRLIDAEAQKNPAEASAWAERFKTAGLWMPVAGPHVDPQVKTRLEGNLTALASQVSSLIYRIPDRRSLAMLSKGGNLMQLRRQIRSGMVTLEAASPGEFVQIGKLAHLAGEVSQKLTVIQFHLGEKDIFAFIHEKGNVRAVRYPGGRTTLETFLTRWRFILEREILGEYMAGLKNGHDEENLWKEIGNWLWLPLEMAGREKNILIISEGELANLPWAALLIDGDRLTEKYRIWESPSLRHFVTAQEIKFNSRRTVLFRGERSGLDDALDETESIRELAGPDTEIFSPCHRGDWPWRGDFGVWHFSGHAQLRADNPFYSYLITRDGPLFAADFRLRQCRVDLVTLAACRSGEQVALPGEETTGLVRSLLEMGARNIIAGRWPVSDKVTALWMKEFYNRYFKGETLMDAVAGAELKVRGQYSSAYYWAAFAVYGAGDRGGEYV